MIALRASLLAFALALALVSPAPSNAEWRSPSLGPPWQPRFWMPAPMDYPVRLYILDAAGFASAAFLHGFPPSIDAFAVWRTRLCWIFTTPRGLNAWRHELQHCQAGQFHQ